MLVGRVRGSDYGRLDVFTNPGTTLHKERGRERETGGLEVEALVEAETRQNRNKCRWRGRDGESFVVQGNLTPEVNDGDKWTTEF